MQLQLDDIAGGKRLLRQVGEEKLVDDALTCDAHRALLFARRMRCDDHAAAHAERSHRDLGAVVEIADHLAFPALVELIGRQVQTRLNEWVIEHLVLFTAGDKREACQIREDGSSAILAKDMQQRARRVELRRCEIATNGGEPLAQFLPISSVPAVPETAEPTFNCAPEQPLSAS